MANPDRHIRRKKLRDISIRIHKVTLRLHNKKAKRAIPRLQAQLSALHRKYDETSRGNFERPARKPVAPKVCLVCHGIIGKGYHICKPGERKR